MRGRQSKQSSMLCLLNIEEEIPADHPDRGARRRILVRRCYLNPNWYQGYRHAFLRAGFEVVDCPPVTSQGKTSTDIHMVLDIVELLQHETRCDEFIVLSADADFTPVLRKLRRFDRRTTVLAIGFPSAAYQASADLLIDERLFVGQALGLDPDTADGAGSDPMSADGAAAGPSTAGADGAAGNGLSPPPTARATDEDRARIAQRIEALVRTAPQPLAAGPLALRLRQEFGPLLDQWDGHGSFKPFFRSLGLDHLVWIAGSGGRIADPGCHALDLPAAAAEAAPDASWAGHEAVFALAREVSNLTGTPLLAPPVVRAVLELLSTDLSSHAYEPTDTARRICREAATERGITLAMREVVFILRGLQFNGHVFGQGRDDVPSLAQRLLAQVLFLCAREQMVLDEATTAQLRGWIAGTDRDGTD